MMRRKQSIFDEMRRMQEQMDSMFENFFIRDPYVSGHQDLLEGPMKKGELVSSNYKQPLSDIYETESEVIVDVEIPGVDKKDIEVHVSERDVEIKAEINSEIKQKDKKKGIYRFERNYSGFSRSFSLPSTVNPDKAKAEYKEGVLKITMPKVKVDGHKTKLLDIK